MDALVRVVREEWGHLVALLLAHSRRLDLVEDALQDAIEAASRRWPADGEPENPPAWLLAVARRRITDHIRGETVAHRKYGLLVAEATRCGEGERVMADTGSLVEDDMLRLVLMCAHPALASDAAAALSLRLVMGVPTRDIARLFLTSESTMAARLTRAKKRIATAGIPFAVPEKHALPGRLDGVAQTAYLAFTAGYSPDSGPELLRVDLATEAVGLARTAFSLLPDEPVLTALLSLVLLQHSRRDARVSRGQLVLLADQDRDRWHWDEVNEARALLAREHLSRPMTVRAASYTLQAHIAAEHAAAETAAATNWGRIVMWYDQLLEIAPSPGARLARSVAVAEHLGAPAGLLALDSVDMPTSHRPAAVRAELLARVGDLVAARAAFDQAIAACSNQVERRHLMQQRANL